MENIDSQRIAILEQRLNELETRVSQLENPKPVTGGTLKRAIEALADKVGQMGETFSNEGRKGRYIIGHDGRRHPVFIAASRNLGSDTGKPMSGWHSINPRNADTTPVRRIPSSPSKRAAQARVLHLHARGVPGPARFEEGRQQGPAPLLHQPRRSRHGSVR